mgnify:CR=1 FL=1
MRFALLVTIRTRPGAAEEFLAAIREAAATAVREEAGCLRFEVARDREDPDVFVLFEVYVDAAALAVHHASPHFLAFQRRAGDLVLEKTRRRLDLDG